MGLSKCFVANYIFCSCEGGRALGEMMIINIILHMHNTLELRCVPTVTEQSNSIKYLSNTTWSNILSIIHLLYMNIYKINIIWHSITSWKDVELEVISPFSREERETQRS